MFMIKARPSGFRSQPWETNTSTLRMKNRVKSNVQMTYPMDVSRKLPDVFANWQPTPSGPQCDSYPFPIQQDQWDLED